MHRVRAESPPACEARSMRIGSRAQGRPRLGAWAVVVVLVVGLAATSVQAAQVSTYDAALLQAVQVSPVDSILCKLS